MFMPILLSRLQLSNSFFLLLFNPKRTVMFFVLLSCSYAPTIAAIFLFFFHVVTIPLLYSSIHFLERISPSQQSNQLFNYPCTHIPSTPSIHHTPLHATITSMCWTVFSLPSSLLFPMNPWLQVFFFYFIENFSSMYSVRGQCVYHQCSTSPFLSAYYED